MVHTIIPKWSDIEKQRKKIPNQIIFKTEEKAENFLKQLQSIHDKYSTKYYWREGKTVYRD